MPNVYRGLAKRHWPHQWHLLNSRPRINRLLRRYDTVDIIFPGGNLKPASSQFPHPLVTFDYDKDGNLIRISAINGHRKLRTWTS